MEDNIFDKPKELSYDIQRKATQQKIYRKKKSVIDRFYKARLEFLINKKEKED